VFVIVSFSVLWYVLKKGEINIQAKTFCATEMITHN